MEDNKKQQRKKQDYSKGKIYKIVCNITGEIYVGHTTQNYLSQRLTQHISNYKRYVNNKSKTYMSSYQIIARGNYEIILIENCDVNSKDELKARERHYIENLKCVNKNVPLRTIEEWRKDNKEAISKQQIAYREENKEAISKRNKAYRENNKDKIKAYFEKNKDKISEYRKAYFKKNKDKIKAYCEENKDKISEYNKAYFKENKDKILECNKAYYENNKDKLNATKRSLNKKKVKCSICNKDLNRSSLTRHMKNLHKEEQIV